MNDASIRNDDGRNTMTALADAWRPAIEYSLAFADTLMLAQRAQWDAMAAWNESLAEFNSGMWDGWLCRFTGGVPLDA